MKSLVLFVLFFLGLSSASIDSYYVSLVDQNSLELGKVYLAYDSESQSLDFNLTTSITGTTTATFHKGRRGESVSAEFSLDFASPIRGLAQVFDINALQSAGYYVEVTGTTESARGQIMFFCLNGVNFNNMCSCFSAFSGLSCQNDLIGTCPRTPVNEVATEIVAELKERKITGNHLVFTLDSKTRINRYFESITVSSPSCAFPGTGFTRSYNSSSCADVFVGNFSIPTLVNTCNFIADNTTSGLLTLSGSIAVAVVDALPSFRGYHLHRITKSVLKVKLNLPTKTNASVANIEVVSPIDLMTAITSQEYDETSSAGILLLTTSVQWPYELYQTSVDGQQIGSFSVNSNFEDTNLCPSNLPCTQVTRITIGNLTPGSNCDFGGWYNIAFQYRVRSGFTGSPVIENPNLSTNITVVSGPSCASVDIDSSISATMESYDHEELVTPKLAFIANTRLYFKAKVTADVNIESVSIDSVELVNQGTVTLLANDTDFVSSFITPVRSLEKSETSFSFIASYGNEPTSLFAPSGDFAQTVEVRANFRVQYSTTFSKKRSVETEKIQASKFFVLDTGNVGDAKEQKGSASALSFGMATPLLLTAAVAAAN